MLALRHHLVVRHHILQRLPQELESQTIFNEKIPPGSDETGATASALISLAAVLEAKNSHVQYVHSSSEIFEKMRMDRESLLPDAAKMD